MHKRMAKAIRMIPAIQPMTMPAIAPPDKPMLRLLPPDVSDEPPPLGADVEVGSGVLNVKLGTIVGRTTPAHKLSVFEL